MKNPEEMTLNFHPRASETVSIEVPLDTLESLRKVAASRDMTEQALLKYYVGQGLRQDLARLFGDRVLETAAQVLTRYLPSENEVSAVIREIRDETYG